MSRIWAYVFQYFELQRIIADVSLESAVTPHPAAAKTTAKPLVDEISFDNPASSPQPLLCLATSVLQNDGRALFYCNSKTELE